MDVSQNNSIRKWNCTFGKQYLEIGRLLCLVELLGATWIHEMNFMTFNEMCFSLSLSVRECVVVINNKYEEIWSHNLGETSKSYYQREFLNTITNSLNMYNTSGFNLKIHNLWRKNRQRLFIILFTSNKSLWSFCNNAINLSDSWGNLWKYLKLGNNIFQATFF